MNTKNLISYSSITPAEIDAVMQRARAERAEVMRAGLVQLAALFSRLVAGFRPIRQRVPHKGAWA